MRIKGNKKLLPAIIALVLVIGLVPAVAAYEAHVVDVRAHWKAPPMATRTPGYWMNHYYYTQHVFTDNLGGEIDLGWRHIKNMPDLMGIFHANEAKNTDKWKHTDYWHRDPLCKARYHLSWHALAAVLNSAIPNPAPMPVTIEDIRATLCGMNITEMNNMAAELDAYNNWFDDDKKYPIADCEYLDLMNITLSKPKLLKLEEEEPGQWLNLEFADCINADCTEKSDCP